MASIEELKLRHDMKRCLRRAKASMRNSIKDAEDSNKLFSKKEVAKKLQASLKKSIRQVHAANSVSKRVRSAGGVDSDFGSDFKGFEGLSIEFPILINGKVSDDSERGDDSYWNNDLLATISRETGYGYEDFKYVDGDHGMWSKSRKNAGTAKGKSDALAVWEKMKGYRDDNGRVTEQLQFFTHSRGSVFGAAYMESLKKEVAVLAKSEGIDFAYNVEDMIVYSVNMGPHQSNSLNYPESGAVNVNVSHFKDILSGNDAKGDVINIHSNAIDDSDDVILEHGNGTFTEELEGILEILENNDTAKLNQLIELYKEIERTTKKTSRIDTGSGLWVK